MVVGFGSVGGSGVMGVSVLMCFVGGDGAHFVGGKGGSGNSGGGGG